MITADGRADPPCRAITPCAPLPPRPYLCDDSSPRRTASRRGKLAHFNLERREKKEGKRGLGGAQLAATVSPPQHMLPEHRGMVWPHPRLSEMRCRMADNARLLSAPTALSAATRSTSGDAKARTRIGGHRDGSTHPQLEALQKSTTRSMRRLRHIRRRLDGLQAVAEQWSVEDERGDGVAPPQGRGGARVPRCRQPVEACPRRERSAAIESIVYPSSSSEDDDDDSSSGDDAMRRWARLSTGTRAGQPHSCASTDVSPARSASTSPLGLGRGQDFAREELETLLRLASRRGRERGRG